MGESPADTSSDVILTLPNNILVRRYRDSDVRSLSHHGNNKKIWDNLRNRMPYPYLESHAKEWISINRKPESLRATGPWNPQTGSEGPLIPTNYTIVINDEACGSIGLDCGDPVDIYFRCGEVGYWLSETHWGKGVMSVAVPAFVDWCWKTFGFLIRINGEVAAENVGSRKCLEKAGLKVEGRKAFGAVKNGVLMDEILMGMLRPGVDPAGDRHS